MKLAINIMTGLVRTGYWGGWALVRSWKRQKTVLPDRTSAPEIPGGAALEQVAVAASKPDGVKDLHDLAPHLGQPVIRYGDGFSVVCHCYPEEGRVKRTLWFDYTRLRRRYGAWVERRLRLRAGHAVEKQQAMPCVGQLPVRPWGRIELPESALTFVSLQDQALILLLEQTMEEARRLIDAEVPDGLLHKKPWHLLPPAPLAEPVGDVERKRQRVIDMTMAELTQLDARRKKPLAETERVYPERIKAPEVRKFRGTLLRTGFVEHDPPSGRKYRTFFAEVQDEVQVVRHTGSDLQRALLHEGIEEGDMVEVFAIGLVPLGGGRVKKKIWSARKVS